MKAFDIELEPCSEASATTFAELDAVAFPSSPGTVGERADEVLTDPRCPIDRYFLRRRHILRQRGSNNLRDEHRGKSQSRRTARHARG